MRDRFAGVPRWKVFLAFFVVFFLVAALVGVIAKRANAYTSLPDGMGDSQSFYGPTDADYSLSSNDVCGGTGCGDTKQTRPSSPEGFVANFEDGDYGHTRGDINYSSAFHDWWIATQKQHAANTGDVPNCVQNSTTGGSYQCTWDRFENHDTCMINSLPDTFGSASCTLNGGTICWSCKVSSPYWTARGELQNKWEARIVWCGTVGLITFRLSGSLAGALGSGSGVCLGGKAVP